MDNVKLNEVFQEVAQKKAQLREIILEAIRNGDLEISLSIEAERGAYDSGDGVKAVAQFQFNGETITEGETENYISVSTI